MGRQGAGPDAKDDNPMAKIGIVYFSGYGHTAKQAEAVHAGAAGVSGVEVTDFVIGQDGNLPEGAWDALAGQDAIIYGSPTYMGGPAWQFKKFADESSKPWIARAWQDKIAAGFTNSGSRCGDKLSTLVQLALFAAQHGMHWISLALPPANCSTTGSEDDLNRLGFWLGAGAQSNTDQGPDAAPPESDLATARHLGQRVAETTLQFVLGRATARRNSREQQ